MTWKMKYRQAYLESGYNFGRSKSGEAVINIRYPVTFSEQQIRDNVNSALEGSGIEVEYLNFLAPLHVPEEGFLIETLKKCMLSRLGSLPRLWL